MAMMKDYSNPENIRQDVDLAFNQIGYYAKKLIAQEELIKWMLERIEDLEVRQIVFAK